MSRRICAAGLTTTSTVVVLRSSAQPWYVRVMILFPNLLLIIIRKVKVRHILNVQVAGIPEGGNEFNFLATRISPPPHHPAAFMVGAYAGSGTPGPDAGTTNIPPT